MQGPKCWGWFVLAGLLAAAVAGAQTVSSGQGRAAWLLERAQWDLAAGDLEGQRQGEIGGGSSGGSEGGGSRSPGVPMLMSMLMPGAGEAYLGYKRGYLMMAVDVTSWIYVKHYHDKGGDLRSDYYAYADQHWSEAQLDGAFDPLYENPYIAGYGRNYFPDVDSKEDLPLWVSRQADEREYFENLGKWDQFVFGWDDFTRPDDIPGNVPTGTIDDLKDPRVSAHREAYRKMRQESNDQFTKRDRLLYFNIAMRVLSVFQVAYLQGMLGGGSHSSLRVAGHPVNLIAEPRGLTSSIVGLAVSY